MKTESNTVGAQAEISPTLSDEQLIQQLMKDWPIEERKRVLDAFYHFFMNQSQFCRTGLPDHDYALHEERAKKEWLVARGLCELHGQEGEMLVTLMLTQERNPDPEFVQQVWKCWNQADSEFHQRASSGIVDDVVRRFTDWVKSLS